MGHYVCSEKQIKHYVHPNYLHKVFLLPTKLNLSVGTPERANQKQNPRLQSLGLMPTFLQLLFFANFKQINRS